MIIQIKDKLYNSEDEIREILEEIGCHNINKISENQFRFGKDDEGSSSGNSLFIDTLSYRSFSSGTTGDIITLISEMKEIKLGDAIKWLANKLHIKKEYIERNITLPFGGFFKQYGKSKDSDETPPKTYDNTILDQYIKHGVSKLFIEDGINALTQERFSIGYDIVSNRVTIPWHDDSGSLVGIMGRKNKKELGDKEQKYLPIIDFRKSTTLYGLYENYQKILNDGYVIIAESEKSVLKGDELGLNVVALGGNNISPKQAKLIKSMFCKVIISLDEGISLEHNIEQAKKVQINNVFFSNEVYIVNMSMETNPYIKQPKVSLLDLDKATINKILEENLIYID